MKGVAQLKQTYAPPSLLKWHTVTERAFLGMHRIGPYLWFDADLLGSTSFPTSSFFSLEAVATFSERSSCDTVSHYSLINV